MLLSNRFEILECESYEEKMRVWDAFFKVYPNNTHRIENVDDYINKVVKNARIIAIQQGDDTVGFVAFYANDLKSGVAYITQILVVDEYRHLKFGKALLEAVEKTSREEGFSVLRLEVNKTNTNAMSFYEHHGFVRMDEKEHTYYMQKIL